MIRLVILAKTRIIQGIMKILGVTLSEKSKQEAQVQYAQWLQEQGSPIHLHQIVTVNPEFIMEAQKNGAYRDVLNGADMALVDGAGIQYIAALKKNPVSRYTGVDLVEDLLKEVHAKKGTIYAIGLRSKEVGEATEEIISTRYPNLTFLYEAGESPAGSTRPVFTELNDKEKEKENVLCEKIRSSNASVLFVAYGSPTQDIWIARNKEKLLGVKIAVGVGGAFDYISGAVPRAPRLVRAIGMEWLVRLIVQPHRINRIITATIRFPWTIVKSIFKE